MAFAAEKLSPICTLCCQEATVWVVGPCDHTLCLTCSARMKILCKKNECPVCRVEHAKVARRIYVVPYSLSYQSFFFFFFFFFLIIAFS